MNQQTVFDRTPGRSPRILMNAAALVIVVAGLREARSVVILLLVSVFLAMIGAPALIWLKNKRVPSTAAVLVVVVSMIGILSLAGFVIGTSINSFIRGLPAYRAQLNEQVINGLNWLEDHGLAVHALGLAKSIEPGAIMGFVGDIFTSLGGVLGNSLIIILIVTFILLEIQSFPLKLRAAFSGGEVSLERFREIAGNVDRYLALKTFISLITGAAVALWVTILGLDFPQLWGFLAFLLNYIPTLGSFVAAVPAVALGLIQLGLGEAVVMAIGYVVINTIMGNIVEPRMMGRSLGLSTTVVFLSLLAWGWVLGTVGMFLAVPLTSALRIVLESSENTRWIAILIGSDKNVLEVEQREPSATQEFQTGD